jgi:hypothetical protein|tara:strand:+ start:810 stop:1055 length:246 start_codon:yes stop_codon:yes gene_type:complete
MEAMNEKFTKDETKLENTSVKRKLELEGYQSDLQNLEKRMSFYQNYIGKLKKLVDRDQGVPDKNMFGADQDIILEQIAEEE